MSKRTRLPAVWECFLMHCADCDATTPHDAIAQEGSITVVLCCQRCLNVMRGIR